MTRSNLAPRAEPSPILDLLRSAGLAVFPGNLLETLIDRVEALK